MLSHFVVLYPPPSSRPSTDGHHLQRGGPERRQASLRDPELHQPQRGALQGVCGGRLLHRGGEAVAQELPVWTHR